jgi:hypothetical protein
VDDLQFIQAISLQEQIRKKRFVMVVSDPESYCAKIVKGADFASEWTKQMFFSEADANQDEIDAFENFMLNPDNWNTFENTAVSLCWNVGGDSSGTISFYLITEP